MKESNIIGIDLAKNVFHICVMNKVGRVLKRKRLSRLHLLDYVVNHYQGTIAMEACSGAHYWARRFKAAGYEVKIIAAQFVKPFVKSNKNDEVDAEAICEAASRPQMRLVSMRDEEQQDVQNLHRMRERLVKQRTGVANEIRGFLQEYGIIVAKGISHVRNKLPGLIEEHGQKHSSLWKETFESLYEEFCWIDERIEHYSKQLCSIAKSDERCKRLTKIPGVGVLTATAIVAAVGNPKDFKNARQFAAWLGLTPRQYSTGGKVSLGRITKRGDKYIRKLLVQGARSAAIAGKARRDHKDPAKRQEDLTTRWVLGVASRSGDSKAIVALANKNARRVWKVLDGREFMSPEQLMDKAA